VSSDWFVRLFLPTSSSDPLFPSDGILGTMYIGPDAAMPIASALAAVVGVAVMFWHKTVALAKGTGRAIARLFGKK
jgi:undecaprenyl pyrophosphate phosphatase UppP